MEDVSSHIAHSTELIKFKEPTPTGQLALGSHFRQVHGIQSSPSCSVLMNNSLGATTRITMIFFLFAMAEINGLSTCLL